MSKEKTRRTGDMNIHEALLLSAALAKYYSRKGNERYEALQRQCGWVFLGITKHFVDRRIREGLPYDHRISTKDISNIDVLRCIGIDPTAQTDDYEFAKKCFAHLIHRVENLLLCVDLSTTELDWMKTGFASLNQDLEEKLEPEFCAL